MLSCSLSDLVFLQTPSVFEHMLPTLQDLIIYALGIGSRDLRYVYVPWRNPLNAGAKEAGKW